jgi:hypothetical protein
MMERSSRFLSLSGWAGILPGIFALTGLSLATYFITQAKKVWWFDGGIDRNSPLAIQLVATAMIVLGLSILSSWYTCMRKARKDNQSTWNPAIRNMLLHLSIPLVAGALVAGWVFQKEQWGLMAPILLAFYGLALVQVSQFTLKSVFWLGLFEIVLSIPAGITGWGIPVLAIGFGFAHIIYGLMMFNRNRV